MKFNIEKAGDSYYTEQIDITTINELEVFANKHKIKDNDWPRVLGPPGQSYNLIIDFENKLITIYDGYIE